MLVGAETSTQNLFFGSKIVQSPDVCCARDKSDGVLLNTFFGTHGDGALFKNATQTSRWARMT